MKLALASESQQRAAAIHAAFVVRGSVSIEDRPATRLMVVLRTNGCAYDKDKKGCTMCDFIAHAVSSRILKVRGEHLLKQLDEALRSEWASPPVDQIDLLTLGSFFHSTEVDQEARRMLLQRVAQEPSIRRVVIESRAPYITVERLQEARSQIGEHQDLEIGLGIESANDHLRNEILNKGLTWPQIETVVRTCRQTKTRFMAYLLIKPQTLSESESIEDAIHSAKQVAELCRSENVPFRIAFEPVFITENTPLDRLYQAGDYQCCSLWTVVEVLKRCRGLGTIFVGLSDEGLSHGRFPRGCAQCDGPLRKAIEGFNATQCIKELDGLTCDCRAAWLASLN